MQIVVIKNQLYFPVFFFFYNERSLILPDLQVHHVHVFEHFERPNCNCRFFGTVCIDFLVVGLKMGLAYNCWLF